MVVSPGPSHSLGILVVWHNVVVVRELMVADSADSVLFRDFPLQKFPHFSGRSEFPVSPGVIGVLDSSNARLRAARAMGWFTTTATEGSVERAIFIVAEFHKVFLLGRISWISGDFEPLYLLRKIGEKASKATILMGYISCNLYRYWVR